MRRIVYAKYKYIDDAEKALEKLFEKGIEKKKIEFYSPFPIEHIQEELRGWDSPVKYAVLGGGILGFLSAIGLVLITSLAYILPVGGKPVVAWPPYIIVMFELTVLLGSIFNLLSLLLFARLPDILFFLGWRPFLPSFADDSFGIAVETDQPDLVKSIFTETQAEEIRELEIE